MLKMKKFLYIVLALLLLFYYVLGSIINDKVYAATTRHRDSNYSNLNNTAYPGIISRINELKMAHPNWTFTILYTGLDWETVIKNETTALHGRSLVQNSSAAWICPTCGTKAYDNGTWYCASGATLKYYMDVRNWLTEDYIFSFETLSYDSSIHTLSGINAILKNTFMDKTQITYYDAQGNAKVINKSYAQVIMEAAKEYNVSPYHLASRLRQEQGVSSTSALITGKCTYKDENGASLAGYYNYFNIRASGNGTQAIITNGLKYAKSKGWTTPELAIKGGAEFLASGYINNYQDCLYLEKYQVDSAGGLYSHQYMQNVSAPYTEGYATYIAYKEIGVLNNNFNFIIPVYENMQSTISPRPTVSMNIVTENVKITTSSMDLPLRMDKSANSTKLIDLPRNTVVLRIEKATIKQNDYYWDKIVYDTGSKLYIGYANSEYLTKVTDVTKVKETNITTECVNLRNGPGLSGTTVVNTLASGTTVTVIDKMKYNVDNYLWYRIKLADGKQGYMASKYLTTAIKPPQQEEQPDTVKYVIDGAYLKITPQTKITDIQGAQIESPIWGTGATVSLNNSTYTLVMLGDVNNDGSIKASDYVLIKNYIMTPEKSNMNDAQKKAADANKDSAIKASDYVLIKNYIMNGTKISL